jgi:membrane dipeptidase
MNINSLLVRAAITLVIAAGCVIAASPETSGSPAARVARVLAQTPLIDGHNDLAWQIRDCFATLDNVDLRADTAHLAKAAKSCRNAAS